MENNTQSKHHFYSVGLSYKKADAEMRGKFSLDTLAKRVYLNKQNRRNRGLIVTSTCNRTEIYGFAEHLFN
jgi:glutamyl-tRNA reductase